MNRRRILVTAGAFLVAGCSSTPDEGPSDETTPSSSQTESGSDSHSTPEETPRPATYEISTPADGQALRDGYWQLEFSVRNTGGQRGEFDTTLQLQSDTGDWTDVRGFSGVFEPGQQRTFDASIRVPDREQATYRLTGSTASWTMTFRQPARYIVTIREAPEQIEIGETLSLTVEITNVGDVEQEKHVSVGAGSDTSSLAGDSQRFRVTLRPGESTTRTAELGPWSYLGTLSLYTDAGQTDMTVDVGRQRLAVGNQYTTPSGVEMAVVDAELTEAYTYETNGQKETRTAADGSQFVIATIRATNTTSELREAPSGFSLYGPSGRYQDGHYLPGEDEYEASQLLDGATREGKLLWEIPETVERQTLQIIWSEETYEGDLAVSWQA